MVNKQIPFGHRVCSNIVKHFILSQITTSTCLVTKQFFIVFDHQTFPHLDWALDSTANATFNFAAQGSNNSPSKPRIYPVFRNKIL